MVPHYMPIPHCISTPKRGTPITQIITIPLISNDRPLQTLEELSPRCVLCLRGKGESGDPNLIQCESRLRWIHTQCLPKHVPATQIILIEGWPCHECEPPSTSHPCSHQLCTIQFSPTPHTAATINKLLGGKMALSIHILKYTTIPPPSIYRHTKTCYTHTRPTHIKLKKVQQPYPFTHSPHQALQTHFYTHNPIFI